MTEVKTMPTAKNLTYLRARNQGAILQTLLQGESISKQELSRRLNLTPMSISYIAGDLLEKGILIENRSATIKKETLGRRGVALSIAPNRLLAVGVSVSRRHLRVSLVELCGKTLKCISHQHDENVTTSILTQQIVNDIKELLPLAPREYILGIGVSCIGLVDIQNKTVISTTDFYGINTWPIGETLQKEFDIPCFVAEDMKAAGLTEHYYGTAKGLSDFIYLGITYGLGAGVIAGGKLLEGNRGFCGEVGHTTLHYDGIPCVCGNRGCAEKYLSVSAITERLGLSSWQQFIDLCKNEPDNSEVATVTKELSTLIVNIINNYDSEAIIIGHEGADLPEQFFENINRQVNARILARSVKNVSIISSSIPEKIHELNGAAIVFFQLFAGNFKL
jgi:predicted NBD/HSP70 family sugar kinase